MLLDRLDVVPARGSPAGEGGRWRERPAGRPTPSPPDEYVEAEIQRLLTEHNAIAEQGITVVRRDHALVLCGEVESPQRREEILRRVAERFPDMPVTGDIGVIRTAGAEHGCEELP